MITLLLLGCPSAPPCPEGMIYLDARVVPLGAEEPTAWQQPARLAQVGAVCMDRYEWPNREGELALGDLTWEQANSHCASVGKRLCTSDEWGGACRGTEGRSYSYGDRFDRSRCNTPLEGSGPGSREPPIAAAGSHPGCCSPEGVCDLDGNLSEWVSDPWAEFVEPFNANPDSAASPERWRQVRGGTMWSDTFYGQDCTSRHGHDKNYWRNADDGFRCCADPI